MLYFDRTDVSEESDVNKTSESKECNICHYWYFLEKGFKSQPNFCNRRHDLLIISINLIDYRCTISRISKNEAINLMQNAVLTEHYKAEHYKA